MVRSVSNEPRGNESDVYVTNASKLIYIMQQKRDLEQERRYASRIPLEGHLKLKPWPNENK